MKTCSLQQPKTVSGLGKTPARVNRLSGAVFLNAEIWHLLSESAQKFILAHEEGHFCKQTKSEYEADKYAFNKLAGATKKSLRNIHKTINTTLEPKINPEHNKRVNAITRQVLLFDFMNFGNNKAYQIFKVMENKEINNLFLEFLRSKGVTNVNQLTNDFKNQLVKEFLLTSDMQDVLIAQILNNAENIFSNYVSKLEPKAIKIPIEIKERKLTILAKQELKGKPLQKITPKDITAIKKELKEEAKKDISKKVEKLNKALLLDADSKIMGNTIKKVLPNIEEIIEEEKEETTNGKTNDKGGKKIVLPDYPKKEEPKPTAENKDKKTITIVVIAVLVVAVIGLIFYKSRN